MVLLLHDDAAQRGRGLGVISQPAAHLDCDGVVLGSLRLAQLLGAGEESPDHSGGLALGHLLPDPGQGGEVVLGIGGREALRVGGEAGDGGAQVIVGQLRAVCIGARQRLLEGFLLDASVGSGCHGQPVVKSVAVSTAWAPI